MAEHERSDQRKQRLERRRRKAQSERQAGVFITVGGIVAVLIVLFLVLLSSSSSRSKVDSARQAAVEQAQSEQLRKSLPPPVPTVVRKPRSKEQEEEEARRRRRPKHLGGDALREQIDKEFRAAQQRAKRYAKRGQWGKALKAYEHLNDRYDDEELRLRCQPEIDELMEKAADTFRDTKRQADGLAQAHRYDKARKLLLDLAKSCEIDAYAEEAREIAAKLEERKVVYLERNYVESLTLIEALLPEWKFEEAVAKASALRFGTPKYQGLLAARTAEFRELVALKKKMIDIINNALPRVQKRAISAPGLPGEFTDADVDGLRAESRAGKEKYTWMALKGEATLRLALLAGERDDAQHRLTVLRLLVEVGYLKQARQQLDVAKRLGVDTAAIEAKLHQKEGPGGGEEKQGKK